MTAYNPIGMNSSTGVFGIAQSGDTFNVLGAGSTSTALQAGNGSGGLVDATAGAFVYTLFTQTANATITNTTTPTSAVGTGVGSMTLAANSLIAGRTIQITGYGIYSAAAVAPGNLTVTVKLGSTTIATTTLGSILSGAASLGYQFECAIVCRTTGSSGTVMTTGSIDYASTSSGTRLFGDLNNAGSTSTINTTTSQLLDVIVTWATASTSNIVTSLNTYVQVIW